MKQRLVYGSVKDRMRPMFSEFDKKFVGKVPNWLRGISVNEPLFRGPGKIYIRKQVKFTFS